MSDQTTAAPSTRVTEAELLACESGRMEIEYGDTRLALTSQTVSKLALEIRRYRALMLGLATWSVYGDSPPPEGACLTFPCPLCLATQSAAHKEDCPWPALEAEVAAIRAERPPVAKP